MAVDFPAPFAISAREKHDCSVIMIHGRGSNGRDFSKELFEGKLSEGQTLQESLPQTCKWIFPSAPLRYSAVFQEHLQEWFDIYSLSDPDDEWARQTEGLEQSINHVRRIILEEMNQVPANRIFVGGISQGFAVASHVLMSLDTAVAGFAGFSGWIPTKAVPIPEQHKLQSLGTPVLVSHSTGDPVVEVRHGELAALMLGRLGYRLETHFNQDDEHWLAEPEGYDQLAAFMRKCLKC